MNNKKWKIDGLNDELSYKDAAKIILANRLTQVKDDIREYFNSDSIEDLHRVRISLRRLRYSMELFISCLDKKKFMILYGKVETLQDLSGSLRDFDVMKENMTIIKEKEKIKLSKNVFSKIDEIRNNTKAKLKLELMRFLHSKAVKYFEEVTD
jgi:CHAD domain-containing protein